MGLISRLAEWREGRRLQSLEVTEEDWRQALGDWQVYRRFAASERERLHDMALRLLLRKAVVGAKELELSDQMRLRIAGMAVVPVLQLGLDWYDGWQTLVIYEGPFIAGHEWLDEYGIAHAERSALCGEAASHGPVVLSLDDVRSAGGKNGHNVVLHELAHTLDMRREGANGAPPLHAGMDAAAWKKDFSAAWDDLERRIHSGRPSPVDDYALEAPAEFFAVLTEAFFEQPGPLADTWPAVYQHLSDFYRQDPRS
ncbi:zinc-dependent peptidase [Halopseudomonas sp.]|uniref:M90 family metallopeptidase n=1 Tax=Halopseudomonas sp. TaxID=2901191 RepID=UPI003561E3C7